jgi:hypothetical protein
VSAAFAWTVTGANVLWGIGDILERHEQVAAIQAARAGCEALGGVYGSAQGERESCFLP